MPFRVVGGNSVPMGARLAFASVLLLASTAVATADPDNALTDMLGPREIAVGEAMRGTATGATAIGLNPAGLPLNRELVFEGDYGYRQEDSSSLVGVSACDSTNGMPGCFFYNYASSNPDSTGMSLHRSTHVGGIALGKMFTPRIMVGATAKYFHFDTDMPGEMPASGFNWDLGTTIRLTDMLNVGVSAQNLWGTESPEFPRAAGGGILARPMPLLSFTFDMRWKLDNSKGARYGGGAEFIVRSPGGQSGFPVRLGALHDSDLDATYISGGLGITTMKFGLDVGARRATSGPDETLVLVSVRMFGPRLGTPPMQ